MERLSVWFQGVRAGMLDRLSAEILPLAKRQSEILSDNGAPSSVYNRICNVIAGQVAQTQRD